MVDSGLLGIHHPARLQVLGGRKRTSIPEWGGRRLSRVRRFCSGFLQPTRTLRQKGNGLQIYVKCRSETLME